jgi:glycosyltransferase involved in cell wall biosynthesis
VIVTSVMPFPPTSGGHKRTLRLMEAMGEGGTVPHLLTGDPGPPGGADELRGRGWQVDVIPVPPHLLSARLRQHLARRPGQYLDGVETRLRELAPGAAFVQFEHPVNAYYWDAVCGTRVVFSSHNVDSEVIAGAARAAGLTGLIRGANKTLETRSAERRAARRADATLAVSEYDQRYFERFSERVLLAPNGVDDDFFELSPALPENHDILFFGHFEYEPNATGVRRFLAEGWPRLSTLDPDARLILAGAAMPDDLLETARRQPRVQALGFVDDLIAQIAQARLVLVPLWNGGGTRLKVLEALASARPIAGTPLGVEQIGVVDGTHVAIAEDPVALAELAAGLLGDRERSVALGREGRLLAERFRWRRALQPATDLYREWAAEATAATGEVRSGATR